MQVEKEELPRVIEALLFATDAPLTVERLRETIEGHDAAAIREAVELLRGSYDREERAFEVRSVAGGWQLASRARYAAWVAKLYRGKPKPRLSRAALETLAVIAYRQPVTRAEVEAIRGVNVDGVMRTLLEKSLVTVAGRREVPGRPLIFGTTREFLTYFGLNDLRDLPAEEELEGLFGAPPPTPGDNYIQPQGPFIGGSEAPLGMAPAGDDAASPGDADAGAVTAGNGDADAPATMVTRDVTRDDTTGDSGDDAGEDDLDEDDFDEDDLDEDDLDEDEDDDDDEDWSGDEVNEEDRNDGTSPEPVPGTGGGKLSPRG